jgi:hypothetical protein
MVKSKPLRHLSVPFSFSFAEPGMEARAFPGVAGTPPVISQHTPFTFKLTSAPWAAEAETGGLEPRPSHEALQAK